MTTPQTQGKRNIAYFCNWSIYSRKYFPTSIPTFSLTHIMYAFANVDQGSGAVGLTDTWSDTDIHYEGDSWNEGGTNLYGNFKALYKLKKQNRNLKVMLSIGGWSYKENFHNLTNPANREKFAETAVKLVEDMGLDGLDIDWEYPIDDNEAQAFVSLLQLCRAGLDRLAEGKGSPRGQYELSIAAPCGVPQMQILRVKEMDQYLDFWNLMAYDFSGSWSPNTAHQAVLYAPEPPSGHYAVQFFMGKGVAADKLVLGVPLYGRAFQETEGMGKPFNGVGQGTLGDGQYDFKSLPLPGSEVVEDLGAGTSYSYDANKRELISYDTPGVTAYKANYIKTSNLGGAMFWELSNDIPATDGRAQQALVPLMAREMGVLQKRANELNYPGSKYDNLRAGMN